MSPSRSDSCVRSSYVQVLSSRHEASGPAPADTAATFAPGTWRCRRRRAAGGRPRRDGRSVQPAGRELAAAGGQRELAVEAMRSPPSTNAPLSPLPQKPRPSSQKSAQNGEAVVELRDVDVGRLEVRSATTGACPRSWRPWSAMSSHWSHDARPCSALPTASKWSAVVRGVRRVVRVRDDHGGRPVDRDVAVVQAQRVADHLRGQVVLEGQLARSARPSG